jgi:hypothetical protein
MLIRNNFQERFLDWKEKENFARTRTLGIK